MKFLIIGIIFNFFSTWYFGWNFHPMSLAEHSCDHFAMMLIAIGFAEIIIKQEIKKIKKK